MKKTSILGLFVALVLFGSKMSAWAANPAYYAALPDGKVLLERPCWVRPDSTVRNVYAWKADSMQWIKGLPDRQKKTTIYYLAYYFESYMPQTALWMQDSIIGFGADVYDCKSVRNKNTHQAACKDSVNKYYPKFYALYTKIEALKEYHPNLYRSYFSRCRPLHFFKSETDPTYEYKSADPGASYPSGHGYVDWLAAMSMLYLDADSTVKIVQMAHELNWYRIINNKHWPSDLDAGNKLASAAFPVLLRSDEYQGLLDATVTEFAAKRTFPTYTDARSHMTKLPDCKRVSKAPFATSSYEWKADSLEYTRALALRDEERGQQAQQDADYTTWFKRFSAAGVMGVDITSEYVLPNLHEMVAICREMAEYAADASRCYTRVAPNTYFAKGQTLTSAVSADAYMAWMMGLCLTYVDTAHATKIERTALDIAEGGYILGDYWQSEIENSEKMGSIGFAMAMRNPHFRALADSAIAELAYAKTIKVVPDDKGDKPLAEAQTTVNEVLAECLNTTKDLQVSRTIYCDGYYNTLCLPFTISAADWADESKNPLAAGTLKIFKSATMDANDVLNIEIADADSIKAGVPYLIKFAEGEDIVNPLFKNITVTTLAAGDTATEAMACKGLFAPDTIVKEANAQYLILGEENTLYKASKADANDYIRGFRAYFKVNDTPAGAAIRKATSAKLSEKTMPTGDSPIHQFTDSPIYKLIDDGQVIIIRDGVKYGINGMVR